MRDHRDEVIQKARSWLETAAAAAFREGKERCLRIVFTIQDGVFLHMRRFIDDAVEEGSATPRIDDQAAMQAACAISKSVFRDAASKFGISLQTGWFGEVTIEATIAAGKCKHLRCGSAQIEKYASVGKTGGYR